MMREITADETQELYELIKQLSEHHNIVSVHFKGAFPTRPYEDTVRIFSDDILSGRSKISVIEEDGKIVGFSKIDIDGVKGKLDYLVVDESYRGNGFGSILMDEAMRVFRESGVHEIEVKVIDGNEAVHLYEKYGFRTKAHILVNQI